MHRSLSLAARYLTFLLVTANYTHAQQKVVTDPTQQADSLQSAPRDLRFEVASIRSVAQTTSAYGDSRMGPHFDPGLYRFEQARLGTLIAEALEVKYNYEIEMPSWVDTEYFALNATPPQGATKADLPIMLRHLLEERFALKYHHETRQMSGYQLVVVKSAPGLTQSVGPAPRRRSAANGPPIEIGKDGKPHLSKDSGSNELMTGGNAEWRGRNETMQQMADQLERKVGAPVMDATGLEGEYDFMLLYTPTPPPGPGAMILPASGLGTYSTAGALEASAPMEHPLLRDALREQLGLALKPIKNTSYDVVIIDSINREPTEN